VASVYERLRSLPLRTKVMVTIVGAVLAVLGISSYFSFRYWEEQALEAAREQALLAAESSRAAVESALAYGRMDQARRNLERLTEQGSLVRARVYGPDGRVVLSGRGDGGRGDPAAWIPDATEIPPSGLVTESPDGKTVRAYLPLAVPDASVFEVQFSVAAVEEAMRRGGRLGLALAALSILGVAVIFFAMVRREVVAPLERIQSMLAGATGPTPIRSEDELDRVQRSIVELMEKGARAERTAEERRRELEERAGLAEVGELAAEMAHELKRPLANVRTAVDLLEQEYELAPSGHELLGAVDDQLDRLSSTMRDLFALARPAELAEESVELEEVVDASISQLGGLPGMEKVELRREIAPDTPGVRGDARRLEQAVANLMTNAVEAMEGGGTLTVRIGPNADGEAMVEVGDTGGGIPPEQVAEVTRPFYSTKPMGTGLGLPLVARIVAAHRGSLEIESEPGEGTTVRIILPRAPARGAEVGDEKTSRMAGGA
jgi:signal transduction histidine kinase